MIAKRLECVQLAAAFGWSCIIESGSELLNLTRVFVLPCALPQNPVRGDLFIVGGMCDDVPKPR